MALTCGDVATGRLRAEKAVELHRELQDDWGTAFSLEAIALSQLADIAVDEGRVADAVSLLKKSHRILRELNDLLPIAAGVGRFASALALAGRAATAAQVLSSSTALMDEIGARPPWFARISRKTLAVVHRQLDDAAFAQAWERGLTMTADEGVALALDSLGAAGATAGSRSRAI